MKPPISIYQFHVIPKISSWILIFDCVFWEQNTIYPTSWYNTRQSLPNNPKANQLTLTGEFFIQSLNDTQEYMVYLKHFLDTCCRYSWFYGVTARSKLVHQEPRILRGTCQERHGCSMPLYTNIDRSIQWFLYVFLSPLLWSESSCISSGISR